MSNKIKETYRGFIDWDGISLDDLKEEIEKLQKQGFTNINIFADTEYPQYSVYKLREETNEEKENRLFREECRSEQIKKRDLAKLAELKAKYE